MRQAIVKNAVSTIFNQPDRESTTVEEVLYGQMVAVLDEGDVWAQVRAQSGAEGFVEAAALNLDAQAAAQWAAYGKMAARAPWLDVLSRPDVQATCVAQLPRGGLVHPLEDGGENGWLAVGLPCGGRGYAKQGLLMPQATRFAPQNEQAQREALATSALSYLGVQYRWGGRSPLGLDSAGLVAMACQFSGIPFGRGTRFADDPLFHPVERDALGMGDVILFGSHCALYLGEGKYVHATAQDGSDGVVINSLDAASPFYRADLSERLSACGSVF